jgi:pimeloyl-ACP methyl ester carboxylesterase
VKSVTDSSHQPVVVTHAGRGPEVLLVHGGASPATTWRGLESLTTRWTLATMHRRGFAPSPPPTGHHQDFDEDAADLLTLLGHRPHVVAHSYGGVGAMLATATAPGRVRSLTLIEPAVHLVKDDPEAEHFKRIGEEFLARGLNSDPSTMREFLRAAGSPVPDEGPLPDNVVAAARRAHGSRSPYEARLPLQALRDSNVRVLVASGAHNDPFERNMDALASAVDAQRIIARGAGHFVAAAAGFADKLSDFLASVR